MYEQTFKESRCNWQILHRSCMQAGSLGNVSPFLLLLSTKPLTTSDDLFLFTFLARICTHLGSRSRGTAAVAKDTIRIWTSSEMEY